MIALGVLGEYIWRILDQVRNRPLYVVEESLDWEIALVRPSSLASGLAESSARELKQGDDKFIAKP